MISTFTFESETEICELIDYCVVEKELPYFYA